IHLFASQYPFSCRRGARGVFNLRRIPGIIDLLSLLPAVPQPATPPIHLPERALVPTPPFATPAPHGRSWLRRVRHKRPSTTFVGESVVRQSVWPRDRAKS